MRGYWVTSVTWRYTGLGERSWRAQCYWVISATWRYTELVRMVCEGVLGYICNMEIYWAGGKKLEDTMLSLLDRNLGQIHHIYQDNFYNNVRLAQTLLDRNMRVCSTMRAKRSIPWDLEGEGKSLKKGQSAFRRNGDVMVQVWKDKTCANDKYDP